MTKQEITVAHSGSIQILDASLVQQSRACVDSSKIVDIAREEGLSDEELSRWADERELIPHIIRVHQANSEDLRTAGTDAEEDQISNAVFSYLRTGGANMSPEARREFVHGALDNLLDLPLSLVLMALQLAPRKVRFPSELLPWIETYTAPLWESRKTSYLEHKRLVDRLVRVE